MSASVVASHAIGFGVSTTPFVYNFNGAPAPTVGDWDVLFVNSDATIVTPSGFTLAQSKITFQGAYAYVRQAVGGEGTTVSITTGIGGGPFNAALGWARVRGADGWDVAVVAGAGGGAGTTSPPISSGKVAATNEIAIAYLALHNLNVVPTNPVWGDGFTGLASANQGSGASGCGAMIGQRNGVGTTPFTASVSWTGAVVDRDFFIVTLTASPAPCPDPEPCPDCPPSCVTITGPDPVAAIMDGVLACAYEALDHTGALAIARVCPVPGDIAWDDCECGQLVISENRRYGSRAFALETPDYDAECGEPVLTVDFTISITRCLPGPDDNGNPPSCEALSTAAHQLMRDKRVLRSAVMCCLTNLYDLHTSPLLGFIIQAQESIGPQGMCGGSELNFLVGFPNGCGC